MKEIDDLEGIISIINIWKNECINSGKVKQPQKAKGKNQTKNKMNDLPQLQNLVTNTWINVNICMCETYRKK